MSTLIRIQTETVPGLWWLLLGRNSGRPSCREMSESKGLGNVTVTQENIDDVAQAGGDPSFDLVESTSMGAKVRQYMLGLMQ